jgi:hypothetical protein
MPQFKLDKNLKKLIAHNQSRDWAALGALSTLVRNYWKHTQSTHAPPPPTSLFARQSGRQSPQQHSHFLWPRRAAYIMRACVREHVSGMYIFKIHKPVPWRAKWMNAAPLDKYFQTLTFSAAIAQWISALLCVWCKMCASPCLFWWQSAARFTQRGAH